VGFMGEKGAEHRAQGAGHRAKEGRTNMIWRKFGLEISAKQVFWIGLALAGWVLVYVGQQFDFTRFKFVSGLYEQGHINEGDYWRFCINKILRFTLNDLLSILFIYGLFKEAKYVRLAFLVMLLGLLILLPLYLGLNYAMGLDGYHKLQFLHRITMNPVLMILLIPAIFYQKANQKNKSAS